MIWLNSWAWLGLAAIAIPIAVHLIGRRRPTHVPFPSIRFLPGTRLAIRRRRRVHDPGLLALRIGIIAAAVAALAGPLWLTADRRAAIASARTRAIVVDTSASLSRPVAGGREAVAVARERAQQLAADTSVSRVVESDDLSGGLTRALGWLGAQPGQREVVLISDFQTGSIDAADLARVPADTGVRIERVRVTARRTADAGAIRLIDATLDVALELDDDATAVTWTTSAADSPAFPVRIVPAPPDAARDAPWPAITSAALAPGVPAGAPRHRIAVTTHAAATRPPDEPWMFDAIRTAHDAWPRATPAARGSLQFAAQAPSTLVAVIDGATAPLTAARVLRSLADAAVARPPVAELEPGEIPEPVTAAWAREPGTPPGPPPTGASDGRWLWALVLILLGVESIVRRDRAPADVVVRDDEGGRDARVA